MDTATAAPFLRALQDSGLYTPDQLTAAEQILAQSPDHVRLAEQLSAARVVTPFQYRKIRGGRAHELLFGPYLLLDKIGEGGMGKVYRAVDPKARRVVALKVVRQQLMSDRMVVERYKREAAAAAALNHPNIVALYAADESAGRYYLAMEYVDGLDLARLVRQFGNPPIAGLPQYQEACEYIRQAALGLAHAHSRGLIHRDIKPSNLIVCGTRALPGTRGQALVKIMDMGLVRSLGEEDLFRAELTRAGTVVGTPDYMAPEQGKNSSTVDSRADLYSLGCTLFYLLRGLPPFPEGDAINKLISHQLDPPPDIRQARPDVPPELAAVLERMLQKNPADRYQTAAEVAAVLSPFTPNPDVLFTHNLNPANRPPVPEPFDLAASPDSIAQVSTVAEAEPAALAPPPTPVSSRPRVILRPVEDAPAPRPPTPPPRLPDPPSPRPQPIRVPRSAPPADETVPAAPVRRKDPSRTRKPLPAKTRRAVPLPLIVGAGLAGIVALVVMGFALFGFHRANPRTPTTPTGPGQVDPRRPAPRALAPVVEILPDGTVAVVGLRPQGYFQRLAYEPGSGGRLAAQLETLAGANRFDARKAERILVAFPGPVAEPLALAEGAFLTPGWAPEGPRIRTLSQEGIQLYEFAEGPARFGAVLDDRAYALGDRATLARLAGRVAEGRPATKVPAGLLTGLDDACGKAEPPLVCFVADGSWRLPGGTALAEQGVERAVATLHLTPAGTFAFEVILSGRDRSRLRDFASEYLPFRLPERYPALKPLGERIARGESSTSLTGEGAELRIRGDIGWSVLHEAIEQLLPAPAK